MYNYTIMALDVEHADEICEDIRRQYESGVASLALFSMALVPEGNPPIPKAEMFCEKYDVFRDKLAAMGLKCGILAQCTIGHGYKLNNMFGFQKYTNLNDGVSYGTCCPYDEDFRDHMRHTFKVLASHKPEVIMVDDDFRLMARSGLGCACKLHLDAFEKIYGKKLTREEIFSHTKGYSDEDEKVTDAFVQTQIDSLIGAAKAMREGIDSVDKKLPGVFCNCGNGAEGSAQIATILAGEGNPVVVRVNNGNYHPAGARYLTNSFQRAAIQMTVMRAQCRVDAFLAETDTCPQNRYSTAASSLHSHFTGTILEGVSGAKHWITRLAEFEPDSGKAYRKTLGKYSGFYEELSRITPTLDWQGCRIPLSSVPDYGLKEGGFVFNGWLKCVLERMGLPVYLSAKEGGAVFMNGNIPNRFSDDEILNMMRGTVVLDGFAAKKLCDRGFEKYMGVDVKTWEGKNISRERILESNKKVGKQVSSFELIKTADAVEESIAIHIPDGKTEEKLFPASVRYKNELGGTCLTFCGAANTNFIYTEAFSFLNESRKKQFIAFLKRTGHLPVYYPGDSEVYLKAANMPDGELFCAFFNISLDEIENVTLVCEKTPNKIERLMPDGSYANCGFEIDNGVITLDVCAKTLMPEIFVIS